MLRRIAGHSLRSVSEGLPPKAKIAAKAKAKAQVHPGAAAAAFASFGGNVQAELSVGERDTANLPFLTVVKEALE